ncbi:MAG TPA: hypothetical protein VFF36_03655, partial [Planctomycetota bacterium]|nr:hypothetical protein [Planctomycetota bacterium]
MSQRELDKAKRQLARAADRQRLASIRRRLRELRHARPERLRAIRAYCRTGRENVRDAVKRLREDVRAELAQRVQAMRDAQRGDCARTREATKKELDTRIVSAARELDAQRVHMKAEYGRKGGRGRLSSAQARRERREESDDEVRRNLPPELLTVWERVRGAIRPGPRRTRTEAFLEWAEENPEAVHAIVYEDVDRQVAELIREQQAIERRQQRGYDAEASLAALEAAPF